MTLLLALASIVAIFTIAGLVPLADANSFRGSRAPITAGTMRAEDLRTTMLDELVAALGSGSRVTDRRLADIETVVKPIFLAMPKNSDGHLDHIGVRYVLHRLFVLRHSMFVKGLEPGQRAVNTTSPTEILEDRVPEYVQELFEARLEGHGLGMHEIAILAATLEHLIHDEAVARLRQAYRACGMYTDQLLDETAIKKIVEAYMVFFLGGSEPSTIDNFSLKQKDMMAWHPDWSATLTFAYKVKDDMTAENKADPDFIPGRVTFAGIAKVVEEFGERYGRWQAAECKDLKTGLMKLEKGGQGAGYVPLSNFYAVGLAGEWLLTESVAYLRDHGVLDETEPKQRSVMVPNYIGLPSNCLSSSSGLYSFCCPNECEPLLGHLEREIAEPDATPDRIADIVKKLPSETVVAPRELSLTLLSRLSEIASYHGGRVPLHGRLFAQWMHHAYPRECPYPYVTGTVSTKTKQEWVTENSNTSLVATRSEKDQHAEAAVNELYEGESRVDSTPLEEDAERSMKWSAEEELILSRPALGVDVSSVTASLPSAFICEAFLKVAQLSAAILVLKHLKGYCSTASKLLPVASKHKYV